MKTKLHYGMKLSIKVHPIVFNFHGLFGLTDSNKEVEAEFIVGKYWEKDTDANQYKVKCMPVDKSGHIGVEKFYSYDLSLMIDNGSVKVLS